MSLVSASTIPGFVVRYRSHGMDGVYSIVAGIVLRVVVDAATNHNIKLSGTIVGLWEGVVLLHFMNKAPTSTDPYLAYGVRLFMDFLITESVVKLLIVMLWSALGMALADVAPAVWADTGMKRQWSRLRRDLYLSIRMFSKRRTSTVRFLPSPTIQSTASTLVSEPTAVATRAPAAVTPEPPNAPVAPAHPPIIIRRRSAVPGTFPGAEWSETETEVSAGENEDARTPIFPPRSSHLTIARIQPSETSEDSYSHNYTNNYYDTSTRSSSPTESLEYSDDPSASNPVDIPSEAEEEFIASHARVTRRTLAPDRETTPKQKIVVLPPTPSESLQDWGSSQDGDTAHPDDLGEDMPPSPWMPDIPDHEPLDEWETVDAEEVAPTPPPKDDLPVPAPKPVSVHEEEHDDLEGTGTSDTPVPDEPFPLIVDPTTGFVPMPVPHSAPPPTPAVENETTDTTSQETIIPEEIPAPDPEPEATQDPPAPPPDTHQRTPPEDLYGSEEPRPDAADPAPDASDPTPAKSAASAHDPSRPATPTPIPSPGTSLRGALSLRKDALEITARIAALTRKRTNSLKDRTAEATAAAVLAKLEIERAGRELAEVNEKAEGAFVGAYNPPTASLYEFNTTGLTPEEAVRQTEARLGKLLLAPVPPPGTTPEDQAFDWPNRSALKVTMEQNIKGRLVKQKMLDALNSNGLNWSEDRSRPNVVFVGLPVTATTEPERAAADTAPAQKVEDDDAKEY